ncbi:hypothetical protein KI387_005182, partial [Taxus chinensis]
YFLEASEAILETSCLLLGDKASVSLIHLQCKNVKGFRIWRKSFKRMSSM